MKTKAFGMALGCLLLGAIAAAPAAEISETQRLASHP